MVRAKQMLDTDAIASCLVDMVEHLRYAQDCTEILRLMLDMLESPDLGSQNRLRILTQQCEAMWFDVQDNATVGLERLSKLCDPPFTSTEPVTKTSPSAREP